MNDIVHHSVPDLTSNQMWSEVSKKVELKHIGQIEGAFKQEPKANTGPKSVDIKHPTRVEVDEDHLLLFVFVDFVLTAKLEVDSEPVVDITTTFMLVYELTDFDGLTDDHYSQFAKTNGVFNAWPYWREYVQSTTVRMGLPTLTVPVLNFYKPKKNQDLATDKSDEE